MNIFQHKGITEEQKKLMFVILFHSTYLVVFGHHKRAQLLQRAAQQLVRLTVQCLQGLQVRVVRSSVKLCLKSLQIQRRGLRTHQLLPLFLFLK